MTDKEIPSNGPAKPSAYMVTVENDAEGTDRHYSPTAERNTAPILEILQPRLPSAGTVLEVASGTGQHITAYATQFAHLHWQPSDMDPAARASQEAWREASALENLAAPIELNLMQPNWDQDTPSAIAGIMGANLLHISPWAVTQSLITGAGRLLPADGLLFIYGCFSRNGDFVSDSNIAFDESLRGRNPTWGVRDTLDVDEVAVRAGFEPADVIEMPANNTVMAWRRGA